MERKDVLLSEEELARQRAYMEKIRAVTSVLRRAPLALVDTFGCQQNVADGERLSGMLAEMGFEPTGDPAAADVVLLNTCAIREHAEKRVFGSLGELTHTKEKNPEQIIVLCGCMAQQQRIADKVKESYRHVDLVLGPQAEWRLPELLYEVVTRRCRVFSIEDEHGRIAEELIFGEITTGASQDIRQATGHAKDMVMKYGMSDKVGMLNLGGDEEEVFIGRDLAHTRGYSEQMAALIDSEIKRIVDENYRKAKKVIEDNIAVLHKSANLLLDKEKITREEFEALFES